MTTEEANTEGRPEDVVQTLRQILAVANPAALPTLEALVKERDETIEDSDLARQRANYLKRKLAEAQETISELRGALEQTRWYLEREAYANAARTIDAALSTPKAQEEEG